MQHGHNHFKRRFVQLFVLVNRDAAAVVFHLYAVVLGDNNVDASCKTGKSLVDGVVNHLAHQVVQTLHAGVAYIHGRTLAHCFKSFKNLNIMRRIFACLLF